MKHATFSFALFFVLCPILLFSARFRSVEIQVEQIGPLSMSASVVVYAPVSGSMVSAFSETLILEWGDDNFSTVPIVNGTDEDGDGILDGELIEPGFRKFVYSGEHTFSSAGRYLISVTEVNRPGGILNINFPNSETIPVCVETEVEVFANSTNNRTPVLLEPSGVDLAEVNQEFLHLPNAYDQDDDSIAYEIVVPLQGPGNPVPNYFNFDSMEAIDAETGIFRFAGENQGLFGFAIQISSYRNGVLQDRMIRDMLFFNQTADTNAPPALDLDTPLEIIQEVNVGDTVRFQSIVSDDPEQIVRLTATSGLFSYFDNPATFTIEDNTGTFEWIVRDEHARSQPYPVVIKAEDNFNELGASSFALVRYRVNGGLVNTNEPTVGSWLVYPNPVANELLIQAPAFEMELPLQYQLFNASGQLMQRSMIKSLPGSIEVEALPTGTYYLQLISNNQRWTERFVKQ